MSPGTPKIPSQVALGKQNQNEIIIYEETWTITLRCPRKKTLGVEGKWGSLEQWFSNGVLWRASGFLQEGVHGGL